MAKFRITYKLESAETQFSNVVTAKLDLPEDLLTALTRDPKFSKYIFISLEKLE
jgi:hypothetical protein